MSKRFWTADIHFGHANIAMYCGRPWFKPECVDPDGNWMSPDARELCANDMNEAIINNMNGRIKQGDTVMHVGDFCTKGAARGVPGTKVKAAEWESKLNGKWIHITGNHDKNNTLKFSLDCAMVSIGNYDAFVIHIPPYRREEIPDFADFVICGHVHEKWKWKEVDGVWCLNVGVDQHKFMPIDDSEVISMYERHMAELKRVTHNG